MQVNELNEQEYNYQIIYVDDGSQDGSSQKIDLLQEKINRLSAIHFTKNNGQTAAFLAGFKEAEGEYIITLDADLQVSPADIPKLIPFLNDYDMVIGMRTNRNDGLIKKISSVVGNGVRNFITGEKITDTGCPLKVFKNEIHKEFYPFKGMHRFYPTLARINGYEVKQVPVNHYPRKYGQSKYGINNRMWRGLFDTLVMRWMKKRIINYNIKRD
ncbi:glycosyltransferase family 2 protein [Halanaerobium kushneri]|uniref:glycosyltransferase family 2 protein n=1 Tax=Halanaerobium kushneri TaxID=56779 RepID=UPI002285A58B|nr:glycosyltransferase family 2 protein [Halanaerobium kushneri]